MSAEIYSMRPWPNGWFLSAGWLASFDPMSAMILLDASERLLKESAMTDTDAVTIPVNNLSRNRQTLRMIPVSPASRLYPRRTEVSVTSSGFFTNFLIRNSVICTSPRKGNLMRMALISQRQFPLADAAFRATNRLIFVDTRKMRCYSEETKFRPARASWAGKRLKGRIQGRYLVRAFPQSAEGGEYETDKSDADDRSLRADHDAGIFQKPDGPGRCI